MINPFISVIIPAFNEEKDLPKCLLALQNQNYPKDKLEVIVVDNDSSDKTSQIAKSYNAQVILYKDKHTVGAVRNFGAQQAKGEILAFMDADSYPDSNWVKLIKDEFEKSPKIVAVCGQGLPINKAAYLQIMYQLYDKLLLFYSRLGFVFVWGFNIAVKKDAFIKIGGFNENLLSFDDGDLGIRIQKVFGTRKIIYSNRLIVHTSTRKQEDVKNFIDYSIKTTINHFYMVLLRRTYSSKLKNVR